MTSVVPELLKEHYLQQVVPELKKECGFVNIHQVPKLEKIVLNSRIKADADKAYIDQLVKDIALITGQAPVVVKSKKSIALGVCCNHFGIWHHKKSGWFYNFGKS